MTPLLPPHNLQTAFRPPIDAEAAIGVPIVLLDESRLHLPTLTEVRHSATDLRRALTWSGGANI
jgi:hypothetical protein